MYPLKCNYRLTICLLLLAFLVSWYISQVPISALWGQHLPQEQNKEHTGTENMNQSKVGLKYPKLSFQSIFGAKLKARSKTSTKAAPSLPSKDRGIKKFVQKCKGKRNIAFLKVHKCASSTMCNIMYRYGLSRNLVFALPKKDDIWLGYPNFTQKSHVLPPPDGKNGYNILANHAVYNREGMGSIMPRDTIYIGILREPLAQFLSGFIYYDIPRYIQGPSLKDKISKLLVEPKKFAFLKNNMARDFGYMERNMTDMKALSALIDIIDIDFKLVMIVEHFTESLVLMKRYLCWEIKDILHMVLQPGGSLQQKLKYPMLVSDIYPKDAALHRHWSSVDYTFYHHFNRTFWQKIAAEKADFWDEVAYFKDVLQKVQGYCRTSREDLLHFKENMWNKKFSISRRDCKAMNIACSKFTRLVKDKLDRKISPTSATQATNII